MDTETKKALLEGMSGFLQGAQIGQFNMFVESGAKVVYLEQEVSEEKKKVDCQTLVKCVDQVRELFWGDSSMAVIFCVCRMTESSVHPRMTHSAPCARIECATEWNRSISAGLPDFTSS